MSERRRPLVVGGRVRHMDGREGLLLDLFIYWGEMMNCRVQWEDGQNG